MTTPEDASPARVTKHPRARRPDPERTGPIRGGAFAAAPPSAPPAPAAIGLQSPVAADDPISEAVAHTVRTGYDVVSANIKAGRMAASRFRQGDYNIRDVPGDVGAMSRRLLHLAREVSATSFDVIEQFLANPGVTGGPAKGAAGGPTPPPGSAGTAPPFFPTPAWVAPTAATAAPRPAPPAAVKSAAPPTVPLSCEFSGSAKATVTSAMLSRPSRPTHPDQLSTTPLAAKSGGAPAISGVAFVADAAGEGVVAHIAIPDGQPAGVYATMIYAPSSDTPLGFLSIEIAG